MRIPNARKISGIKCFQVAKPHSRYKMGLFFFLYGKFSEAL